jgi:hypothetical protein
LLATSVSTLSLRAHCGKRVVTLSPAHHLG